MEKIKLVSTYTSFESIDDLPASDKELLLEAEKATKNAYAPYSGFRVGAALRLADNSIIKGNNQENVAYPSGLCAERVALFYASANFPDMPVVAIAITATTDKFEIKETISPCGSCRQVMAETEKNQNQKLRVILKGENGKVYIIESAKDLLPLMFKADELKI
jgi:cytidine deaminase